MLTTLQRESRQGLILLIVVAMLGLFAVLSLAFYYYASQEVMNSRLALDSLHQARPDPDALLGYALRQLVFDEKPPGPFKSQLAMHSLLVNLFGTEGLEPFSGTGRFHGPASAPGYSGYDRYYMVCYWNRQYQPAMDGTLNPPYTFPDFNHCFLGRLATDGPTGALAVLEQSFIRRFYPMGPGNSSYFDPYHPANKGFWTDPNWPGGSSMPPEVRQALVFRPHPLLHPNFPPPADIGGDVRNLPPEIPVKIITLVPGTGQQFTILRHYGNDSIWMDLNFPVQTGPDGKTYKPLFAFFICDLDGRLNLNRIFWDKSQVLAPGENLPPPGAGSLYPPAEMEAILRHGDTLADSFQSILFPALATTFRDLRKRHTLTTRSRDLRYAGFVPQIYREPWNGNSSMADAINVISFLNNNPDFGPRWQSYPIKYDPPADPQVRWPWTVSPFDPPVRNQGDFVVRREQLPNGTPIGTWTGRTVTSVNRYDQQGGFTGTAPFPSRQRLDLTTRASQVRPYPPLLNLETPLSAQQRQQCALAIADRQSLARQIYFRLLMVCGLLDEDPKPIPVPPPEWVYRLYPSRQNVKWPPNGVRARVQDPLNPSDQEVEVLRFFAQLAVNLVDYLDPDDYNTPFLFYTDMDGYPLDDPWRPGAVPDTLRYWVFGTELPKVVLNEVLFEYQEPFDNGQQQRVDGPFDMRCWVELFNASNLPVILGRDDPNSNGVDLSRYRVVIVNAKNAQDPVDQLYGSNVPDRTNNVKGEFDPAGKRTETDNQDLPQSPWQLQPASYLLLGPKGDTVDATLAATKPPNLIQTDNMKFTLNRKNGDWQFNNQLEQPREYFVLLRRLAFTQMRSNPNNPKEVVFEPATISIWGQQQLSDFHPTLNPLVYNPYVTVDYIHVKKGQGLADRTPDANPNQSISWARTNPYADSLDTPYDKQNPNPIPGTNNQPTNSWHSLGLQNAGFQPGPRPFHPDRTDIPTLAVLRVSAFKPHLLTQRFLNGGEYHYAPWFDPQARIYRVLEFLETTPSNLLAMQVSSHCVEGKLNLNTATQQEIFLALTGPGGNPATWQSFYQQREAVGPIYGFAPGNIAPNAALLRGLSIQDSWWRNDPTLGPRPILADPGPSAGPLHEQFSLFTNLYDRVTTRSNVFAVWCTVGFFECEPNTANPDPADSRHWRIGRELDADIGRQVRYRFFAIVDRTILAEWMLGRGSLVSAQLGRTDIDPRRPGPNSEPPCVIYWSRIQ